MSTTPPVENYDDRLTAAAAEYRARRDGTSRPNGGKNRAGAWHPTPDETRACCRHRRSHTIPTEQGVRAHLRGIEHVANLYEVAEPDLRRALTTRQR